MKWIIADYPVSQAAETYQLLGDFCARPFTDDEGATALTEQDIEVVRQAVICKLERDELERNPG